jgi:hypothetical protein
LRILDILSAFCIKVPESSFVQNILNEGGKEDYAHQMINFTIPSTGDNVFGNDHLSISPNFQYIWNPFGKDIADDECPVFVYGLSSQIDF